MDFALSQEQQDIQQAAGEFARGEFDPERALEGDRQRRFPTEIWQKACEFGFVGLHLPEPYGGSGYGSLENALVVEAFCRQDSGIGLALALADLGSDTLLRFGSREQKERLLPSVAAGQSLLSVALTEDASEQPTFQARAGTCRLSGTWPFVPLAAQAGHWLIGCRAQGETANGRRLFLLSRDTAGVRVEDMGQTLGMRMVPVGRLVLAEVRAPATAMVGKDGQGDAALEDLEETWRIETAAAGVGIAQGAFERARDYSRKRIQFGRPLSSFDAIRHKLADMWAEVESARLLVYRAAWARDKGRPPGGAGLLSKIAACRAARRVTHEAVQVHGALGYMTESHIERFFRDAKGLDLLAEPPGVRQRLLASQIV